MTTDIIRFDQFTPTTPIEIRAADGSISLSVQDVQKWVHPQAPPNEALKFLLTCRMAGVNPFLGEAHLVNYGDRWGTIIDKSGYLKRAQLHPAYNGHEAGVIVQEHDPQTKKLGAVREVPGAYVPPAHLLVGGWARVHRKDRAIPTYESVDIQEYNRGQGTWKQIPRTMIRKVALVQALRESGLLTSGWYDPAEMPGEPPVGVQAVRPVAHVTEAQMAAHRPAVEAAYSVAPADASLPPEMLLRIEQLRGELGIDENSFVWRDALASRRVGHVAELSPVEGDALIRKLEGYKHPAEDLSVEPARPGTAEFTIPDATRRPARGEAAQAPHAVAVAAR